MIEIRSAINGKVSFCSKLFSDAKEENYVPGIMTGTR